MMQTQSSDNPAAEVQQGASHRLKQFRLIIHWGSSRFARPTLETQKTVKRPAFVKLRAEGG